MTRFVALLRAVNVGGTGKLPMADLRAMCIEIGLQDVATYIASGNVVFASDQDADVVRKRLEDRLAIYAGQAVPVMIRTAAQMRAIVDGCPFADAPGNQAVVIFLDASPAPDALSHAVGVKGERMHIGPREIYVDYVNGQGVSKLRIPAAKDGTARNMNTVRKLTQMAKG